MKTNAYLLIVLASILSLTANAQLRLLPSGRVQVGNLRDNNEDLENVTTMSVFGNIGDSRTGSKLSFGDFGRYANQGWNVFLGEYGTTDTDQLWMHGKLGLYMTVNGYANKVVAYYDPAVNANFVFNTNLRVNGVNITSDARLKENIQSLENPMDILSHISGVTYNYKQTEIDKNREQDNSKFTATENMQNSLSSQSEADASDIEKENRNRQIQIEIDQKEADESNRKRIGFLAQDVQKVLPELVRTDDNGLMSIDYIGFIPLIVESVKEMEKTIQKQSEQIAELQHLLNKETELTSRSISTETEKTPAAQRAILSNREGASVAYSLPSIYTTASLHIFDIAGKTVKKIDLQATNGILDINPSEIGFGTFVYALIVDGQKADMLKKFVNR